MSNPMHGFRFIHDGDWMPPKENVKTGSKIFQASKLKRNSKKKKRR